MAIQCKYCGTELPKDDARFCNNCGMLVPSHPFSPQSLSALKSGSRFPFASSSEGQQEGTKRVLREQVAELAPARSTLEEHAKQASLEGDGTLEERPVEVEKIATNELSQKEGEPGKNLPETPKPEAQKEASSVVYKQMTPLVSPRHISGVRRKISGPIQLSPAAASAWPAAVTHISRKEAAVPGKERLGEQNENAPVPEKREFHVGVWQDKEMRELTEEERQAIESMPTRSVAAVPVEDAPTQAVVVPTEDVPTQEVAVSAKDQQPALRQAVEQLPSSPFLSVPPSQTVAQEMLAEDWRVRSRDSSGYADPSMLPVRPNAAPFVSSAGYQPIDMPGTLRGEKDSVAPAPPVRRSGRRWPVVVMVVVVLLVVFAAGAVGVLMMLSQQSSRDPIVQAQVSFTDSQLGISLLYPNGWIKQVDAATSTAHFYASNHIGQVDVMVASGSGTVKQALQQQATKVGMSGTKAGASLNFAGVSWQQLQGTMKQGGANYTDTILATMQGGKLFMIVQQAPQNDYAEWEKEFFGPLRDSFKFL